MSEDDDAAVTTTTDPEVYYHTTVPYDGALETLTIYTDGSAKRDRHGLMTGGFAGYFGKGDVRNFAEPLNALPVTNNRCELMAAIRALERCDDFHVPLDQHIVLAIDSQYVIFAVRRWWDEWQRNGFRRNTVKNQGLIRRLHALAEVRPVSFLWVRGHTGEKDGNWHADAMANDAADGKTEMVPLAPAAVPGTKYSLPDWKIPSHGNVGDGKRSASDAGLEDASAASGSGATVSTGERTGTRPVALSGGGGSVPPFRRPLARRNKKPAAAAAAAAAAQPK